MLGGTALRVVEIICGITRTKPYYASYTSNMKHTHSWN